MITDGGDVVYYAIKINGQVVGPKHRSVFMAEQAIQQLSETHRSIAEVVPVTTDGKELLLG